MSEIKMRTIEQIMEQNFDQFLFNNTIHISKDTLKSKLTRIRNEAMMEGMGKAAAICAARETSSDFTIEATRCKLKILTAAEHLEKER
jgi:hypothetical protein